MKYYFTEEFDMRECKKASELFPALDFDLRYFEGSVGFNGVYRCQSGQVEHDRVGDYFGERGG